ncbi:MAG TPA: hypothetical protein VI815_02415 [Candidatus Nanoarchaeia archaeon]|nr:hypothetical protein [Candidatus Nanoarchaeia archaeon]
MAFSKDRERQRDQAIINNYKSIVFGQVKSIQITFICPCCHQYEKLGFSEGLFLLDFKEHQYKHKACGNVFPLKIQMPK